MRTITKRLETLEKTFAPLVKEEDRWGGMAEIRDELLRQAAERGEPFVSELRQELEAMGPLRLWTEVARGVLKDHGFEQEPSESFAQTMARALGINTDELRVHMDHGTLGSALANRFNTTE
jgi:hypothetical protein